MGGCQNHGPFCVPKHNVAPRIEGTQNSLAVREHKLSYKNMDI